jgi:hypothetical protein
MAQHLYVRMTIEEKDSPAYLLHWVDPMLEEFAASRVVSWPPALGGSPATTTAPQEEKASLVDTSSPAKPWTTGSPPLSPVLGQPPVTPQWAGHAMEAETCSSNIPLGEDVAAPTRPPRGGQPTVVDAEAHQQSPSATPQPRT